MARATPVDSFNTTLGVVRRTSEETANTAGNTGNDSLRYQGSTSWNRRLSVPLTAGLRLSGSHATFDSSRIPDLNSFDVGATLSRVGSRLDANASLGYSRSKRSGRTSTGGLSTAISSTFRISDTQDLALNLSRAIDDQDENDLLFSDRLFDVVDGNGARSAVGINTDATLTYTLRGAGFTGGASVGYSKSEFDNAEGGRDDEGFDAALRGSYALNPRLSVSGSASFRHQRFPGETSRDDDELRGDLSVAWQGLKEIGFTGRIGWNQRDRTNAALNTREFFASFTLSYTVR